ncbi:acyl-CoA synthetase (AMP-forming)/AMP-acid ligase II [Prauserella sediminis]|uniref:Acyl-CoA synthetase (AMP-forming)/AMP-acid ligase II n=1 Tax=Prauserella sediminis TaxID=577680 RepID=A0A839Y0X2_9PSEU|nr:AMP-binding protein [Prauserella sediminis]MBB3665595.1 acyl-CoA synthetase (AMP-forming)/AMP-acid ligase II [Prauserella sediminis]
MALTPEQRARDLAFLRTRWYEEGHYSSLTLADTLVKAARGLGDTRIVFASEADRREFTLAEVVTRGQQVACGLRALGVGPGDVVAVQMPNRPELLEAYFGIWLAGATLVPVTHIYGPGEVRHILRDSRAKLLIVPDRWRSIDFVERIGQLGDLPDLAHVVVLGEAPEGTVPWKELNAHGTVPPATHEVGADTVSAIIYTSGTTGVPKGVQHTHNTLLAELRKGDAMTGPERDTRMIPWPAGHVAGLLALCGSITAGTHTVVMDRWQPELAVALIEEYRCSLTSGTPLHVEAILDAAAATGRDISSLRSIQVGGANVTPSLIERADAAGTVVSRAYGSTEHPRSATAPLDATPQRRGRTDGRVRFGDEIRIVDETFAPVPIGEVGEIVTRGPSQFVGYRDPTHDLAAFLPGGWYRTGDVGRLDAEGYLTVTDRIKDLIIRGGENISSKEVEDILATHPRVRHVSVVAAPDPHYGEAVAAFVVLSDGAELDLDEVRALFARSGVAPQKAPTRLEVVDDLPRAPSGKVRKFELRDRLRAEAGAPATP